VKAKIMKTARGCDSILHHWDTICQSISTKDEWYSVELLKAVVGLWINIHGHSFARDFTINFEAKFKKGTWKTLIPK